MKKCIVCKKLFKPLLPSQKYCSKTCNGLGTRTLLERHCETCGKTFRPLRKSSLWCSKSCWYNRRNKVLESKECSNCGKSFSGYTDSEFCSWKCRSSSLKEKRKSVCLYCNKEYYAHKNQKYCSINCSVHGMSKIETSIETELYSYLSGRNINYVKQHYMGFTIPDAFIPDLNLCVYADGSYWHSYKMNKGRDAKQNRKLKTLGYGVVRLKEQKDRHLRFEKLEVAIQGLIQGVAVD